MSASATPPLLSPELLARLERLELVTRKVLRGRLQGERRSRRKGQSVEYADFRNYVPGDDLRFMDWNLYARLDKLFLKLFLDEEDLHFFALIDTSTSMTFGQPSKLLYAKQLAAALGFVGLLRADRVCVAPLSKRRQPSAPVLRGRGALWRLLEHLEEMPPGENVALLEGLRNFSPRGGGRGLLVVLSDLLDKGGCQSALRAIQSRNMDAHVIQILSPQELRPELEGDLRLVDSEDADIAEITASRALLDRYHRTVTAFVAQTREDCLRRGIGYLLATTDVPVEQVVTGHLRRRGLVR